MRSHRFLTSSLLALSGTTLLACASVSENGQTVKIVKPATSKAVTSASYTSPQVMQAEAPLVCDNPSMRARVADKNRKNDSARLLIVEEGSRSNTIIADRLIDCRAYFATQARSTASTHTVPARQVTQTRDLPDFVTQTPNYNDQVVVYGDAPLPVQKVRNTRTLPKNDIVPLERDYYEVQKGDNLYRIAREACTTVPILSRINRIADPTLIDVGQILKLPQHSC